jgi:hypothetical protein
VVQSDVLVLQEEMEVRRRHVNTTVFRACSVDGKGDR